MPTMNVMNTTVMTLNVDTIVIGEAVDVSLAFSQSPRTITNKQDSGWRELAEGLREWSFNVNAMYTPNHADFNFADVFTLLTGRTTGIGRITSTTSGDVYYEGDGFLGAGNLNSNGVEDNVVYDFTLEGTGVLSSGATT